ncbi:MAG: RHS repeat-associated core domain-containing protein [Verrucomicrobiota bacterium]|nr:RHS repeat-associated core domain-containing protein [Verrucomicrobiota bacterium]MDQ2949904.1 RHS repeat-associated core domain-containing protein [Acidobacteriota bacterium]
MYPDGFHLRQNFDNLNRLILVGQEDNTNTNLLSQYATYAYNPDSTRRSIVRGNGVQTDYTYEGAPATGRVRSINHYIPGNPAKTISNRTYGYDQLSRMLSFQKSNSPQYNPLENGTGDSYGYDAAGQLTSGAYASPTGSNPASEAFAYDGTGNRTSVNGVAYTLNASKSNQYQTAGSFGAVGYDTHGNLNNLTATGSSFGASYDAEDRMYFAQVDVNNVFQSVSLNYDALGRCVQRTINGVTTNYYYDGWNLIEEDNSGGVTQKRYVHGPATDELAALWSGSSNSWAWYHYDARGSVTHLTDSAGNIVEQYSYSAFGTPSYYDGAGSPLTGSAIGNRFLFQGREWIGELALYDFRNRMYHPGIGRFLQPDPLRLDAGDQNIYRFCNNDPINSSDPLGMDDFNFGDLNSPIGDLNIASLSNYSNGSNGEVPSYFPGPDFSPLFAGGAAATAVDSTQSITNSGWSGGSSDLGFGIGSAGLGIGGNGFFGSVDSSGGDGGESGSVIFELTPVVREM